MRRGARRRPCCRYCWVAADDLARPRPLALPEVPPPPLDAPRLELPPPVSLIPELELRPPERLELLDWPELANPPVSSPDDDQLLLIFSVQSPI